MRDTVIKVENLSKYYRLGLINRGTLQDDLARKWAKFRGKPDLLPEIGQKDHGNRDDEFIWALRNINLELKQGEILGIIGKNGAGKTTLLKILGRITAPTEGRAMLKGRLGCLIAVGTGFHPELTGRENIYLNGAINGMNNNEIDRKVDEIIDFSGVEKFIDTPIKRYSTGMNIRLGFAVAAHLDPDVLIVDEVLSVGDAEFRKKALGKMQDVSENQGRTVLFVSHNMSTIEELCPESILLEKGSIKLKGKSVDVISAYLKDATGSDKNLRTLLQHDELKREVQVDGFVKFTDFEILNADGKETNFFKRGEKVFFNFPFKVYKGVKKLFVEMVMYSGTSNVAIVCIEHNISSKPLMPGYEGKVILEMDTSGIIFGEFPLRFMLKGDMYENHDYLSRNDLPLLNILSGEKSISKATVLFDIQSSINHSRIK